MQGRSDDQVYRAYTPSKSAATNRSDLPRQSTERQSAPSTSGPSRSTQLSRATRTTTEIADRGRATDTSMSSGAKALSPRRRSQEPVVPQTRVDSFPSAQGDDNCDDCGCAQPDTDISFCNDCNIFLCEECWMKQTAHRRQRLNRGGARHEKTNISLARKINNVLFPTSDLAELTLLHENDAQTAWFGVHRPLDGRIPVFMDYGRFAHLLSTTVEDWSSSFQYTQSSRDNRTPSLVSFVGQTGHGKSTIIKLLIDLHTPGGQNFCTPVVGAPGVTEPTSQDVHLYLDPITAASETPIFFADCEGLLGGEREPVSAKLRRSANRPSAVTQLPSPISERELAWADSVSLRSRQYAVTNLFPRLLYTFSDVIVFVLKNPRAIEDVLEHLVEWAAAALEKASNQPVLPHVVIVLNASENTIDESLWDPDVATSTILESMSRTVFRNNTFKKYAQFWRERNRQIETVESLIRSYYSSIKVVRIPEQGRPELIQMQIDRLYASISIASSKARESKAEVRMLLDAEELQSYLQCAFDHFALSLDHPFDFVQASFSNSPIPLDFGGNILKLAINVMQVWKNQIGIEVIFQELSYVVASCIMLDSARKKNLGMASDIFPQYLEHLDAALENFSQSHWPCEYVDAVSGFRCVNVRSGHGEKGHQNPSGKIFADGAYQSRRTFESLQVEFANNCFFRLQELLDLLREKRGVRNDEIQTAAEIHRDDVMAWFYRHVTGDGKPSRYNSHSVCFCCLLRPPEHGLPCGHVLCTECVKIYGHARPGSRTEIEINFCPLEVQTVRASQPWSIHLKPDAAGVRILTLDGGGVRGIVELEVLQALERALNPRNGRLRIQNFFDLVIGTSTGGLIALGLVARNWSIGTCIENFKELCQKAFTRRTGASIPLFGRLVTSYNHSKYQTAPLHEALQAAFSTDEHLFGGQRYDQTRESSVKVGVTTTLSSTSPVLLANYNRRCDDKCKLSTSINATQADVLVSYQFHRAEGTDTELKTWEAARATSAAPRYFKPFHHQRSKQTYLDGALYYNNPIGIADSEWKLIWGTNVSSHPDMVISLGTGYDPQQRERTPRNSVMRRGIFRNGRFLLRIAADHIQDALDCEKIWDEYVRRLPDGVSRSRFVRYSIKMVQSLPALDDVHCLESLQLKTREKLAAQPGYFQNLAMQLMTTSFYFETEKVQQYAQNTATVTGRIHCRFAEGSLELEELGKLIREKAQHDRDAYFSVCEYGYQSSTKEYKIDSDFIHNMTRGKFNMPQLQFRIKNKLSETEIRFSLNSRHTYPISGFPRCLVDDEKSQTRVVYHSSVNARRWAGSSSLRKHHRSLWQPPDRAAIYVGHTITNYSNAEHVMGYATAEQIRSSASYYSHGRPFSYELEAHDLTPHRRSHVRSELTGDDPTTELHDSQQCRTPIAELSSTSTEILALPTPPAEEHAVTTSRPNSPLHQNSARYQYNSNLPYSATEPKGKEREQSYEGRYNADVSENNMTTRVPLLSQLPERYDHEAFQRTEMLTRRETEEFDEWHDSEEWLTGEDR